MENNFLKDLISQSVKFKEMQKDVLDGKAPDIGNALDFITSLPNEIENITKGMSKAEKKKLEPFMKELKEKSSLSNILNSIKTEQK